MTIQLNIYNVLRIIDSIIHNILYIYIYIKWNLYEILKIHFQTLLLKWN